MKIRYINELIDKIDDDLAWRKKELSRLLSDVNSAKFKNETTAIRAAVVLLYAHWEGFIKNAGNFYLNYVSNQKLTYDELHVCFVALTLKNKIRSFESTNKSSKHGEFIAYIINNFGNKANIPNDIINTQSNLSSSVLEEVLISIGIDYTPYSLKNNLIDEQLLNYRNNIAHGQVLPIKKDDYVILHTEITQMIYSISDDIQNAAAQKMYLRSSAQKIIHTPPTRATT